MKKSDEKKKNIICRKLLDNKLFILGIFLMVSICLLHALYEKSLANFIPINGTFQDFNPIRRFLAGQVPFKDFADYLGMGHLFAGTVFTVLFGGNYQGSLYAFSFLSISGLALFSLLIATAVLQNKERAIFLTNALLITILVQPLFFQNAIASSDSVLYALQYSIKSNNSARTLRGSILVIACFLIFIGYLIFNKWFQNKELKFKKYYPYILISAVAGFSFAWSNDYGIGAWLCLLIMNTFLAFARERKLFFAIKILLLSIIISAASLFVIVEILTFGNFNSWVSFTFGTGGYQSWYFNNNTTRSYYPFDVDFSFVMLLQAFLVLICLKKLFDHRGSVDACKRYGILAFLNMSCFAVVNEYKLISGGQLYEVALTVLFITIFMELISVILHLLESKQLQKKLILGSLVLSLAWLGSTAKDVGKLVIFGPGGTYVPALGGNMTNLRDDLYSAHAFLNGESFFATYATAQEVMEGTFQPSGIDYIIHALGDKQRQTYLNAFKNGTFKYAATIREDYSDWSFWMQRANWYFYRELYQNWHPVFANSYEIYWERNGDGEFNKIENGFTIKVTALGETSQKIEVYCEDKTVNGLADVYVDYSIEKNGNLSSKFLLKRELNVTNTGVVYPEGGVYYDHNQLRPKSAEYIPVQVVNGHGEVTITSQPEKSTILKVNTIHCEAIYNVTSKYIPINKIDNEKSQFIIAKFTKYEDDISNAKKLIYQGKEYTVVNAISKDDGIYITVEEIIEQDGSMDNFIQIR